MGQACCAGENDKRMLDYSLTKNKQFQPSSSTIASIKFPIAKKPKKNRIVEELNTQVGEFSPKNPHSLPSGTFSDPRQLNTAGLIYHGEWVNGIPNGRGQLYYPDGSYYVGYLTKGNADGEGRFVSPAGWFYEGQLQNEQAQGNGRLYHQAMGYKYEGMWSGDTPNGHGYEQWQKNDIKYEGDFLNGKKHGQGKYENPELTYEGSFSNDQFDSYGFLTYKSGDKFEGNFQKGKKHGKGIYTWKDGSYYDGSYKYDEKHGQGKYKSADSTFWEGTWAEGKREGMGKLVTEQKKLLGNWSKGIVMRNTTNSQLNVVSQVSFEQSKMK